MAELQFERQECTLADAANANQSWSRRVSFRIQRELAPHVGQGEAAPLPGFSRESESEVETALLGLSSTQLDQNFCGAALVRASPAEMPHFLGCPPSVQFALQSAWLDLLGQVQAKPCHELLFDWLPRAGSRSVPKLPSAAQLLSLQEGVPTQERLNSLGARTLKVKVGGAQSAAHPHLFALRQRWPGRLRLDANGSLGPNWEQLLAAWAPLLPEFVEEPCPLRDLGPPRALPCPIAFDESLLSASFSEIEPWLSAGSVGALVLKPMLLGDLHEVRKWAKLAHSYAVPCVISHLFDGGAAMSSYRQLAAAWGSEGCCSGLGAHSGLPLWPLAEWSAEAPGLGFVRP